MPISTRIYGEIGEDAAVDYLRRKGYEVIDRNFKSSFGEIDIVAQYQNVLVFVEVKTRWSKGYGYPEEAVTPYKLRRLLKTADYYKLLHPDSSSLMRVDVVAIEVEGRRVREIRHIENVTC